MSTVLALNGDEVSLLSLQDILETFGHTLVPAGDAAAALACLAEQNFDLVLVDIGIPGMASSEVVARMVGTYPGLRVVAVTAYPKEALAAEVLASGAHSLMRKPYEVGRILQLLEEPRP